MNPLILLALGGVALVALRKKPKTGNGNGDRPNGGEPPGSNCASWGPVYHEGQMSGHWVDDGNGGCILQCASGYIPHPDGDKCVLLPEIEEDHIVEEGQIDSAGGLVYAYRIWRMYSIAMPYVGEILLDAVWTSGPMGQSQDEVGDALQVMVDSLDLPQVGWHEAEPEWQPGPVACTGVVIDGPFDWYFYEELGGEWEPIGETLDPLQVYEPGRGFCVIEDDQQPGTFVAQVYDVQTNQVMVEFAHPDPSIAASMAYYGLYNPGGPFPWVKFQLAPSG